MVQTYGKNINIPKTGKETYVICTVKGRKPQQTPYATCYGNMKKEGAAVVATLSFAYIAERKATPA